LKRALLILIITVLALLLPACETGDSNVGEEMVRKVAAQYYETLKLNDFAAAVALCSDKNIPAERWMADLKERQEKLGDLQSYVLKRSMTNTVLKGKIFVLDYKVEYTNGHSSERMTLRTPLSGDIIEIVSMKVR